MMARCKPRNGRAKGSGMPNSFILAINQGSTATRCALVDGRGRLVSKASAALSESHPAPGWVDQNPSEILASLGKAVTDCLAGRDPSCVEAVALGNQRESVLLWDRRTGLPVSSLISWQDTRSTEECERIRALGHAALVHERSGLPLDPMFSALKAKWLLDIYDPDRSRANAGEIGLGTVDSFLLGRFSGTEHLTEVGNASRTQLLNLSTGDWDDDLLRIFNIPRAVLPRVTKSNGPFPSVKGVPGIPDGTPILAVLGNSHASLFGHGAFRAGILKATYGSGCSVMGLVENGVDIHPGLCRSIAWNLDGKPVMAVEANIRSASAALRWVAGLFGIAPWEVALQAERLHAKGRDGAVVIPGFNGLGAPWWDNNATGLVSGLTLDSRADSLFLGAMESIPQQIADVLDCIAERGGKVDAIYADGDASSNAFLMHLQADLAGAPVFKSTESELAALGAAHMAGLGAGWWTWKDLEAFERPREIYHPLMPLQERERRRGRWRKAMARARL